MKSPFPLAGQELRQLELLYSYNRIPVRFLDQNGDVSFCSCPSLLFMEKGLKKRLPSLFKDGKPVICCEGSLEVMAAFPAFSSPDAATIVIGPAFLEYPRDEEKPLMLSPSGADRPSVIRLLPVVSLREFVLFVQLIFTGLTNKEISAEELLSQESERSYTDEIPKALIDSAFRRRENEPDHIPYERELTLLHVLRSGGSDELSRIPDVFGTRSGLRFSEDPLRQAIYEFVGLITGLTGVAIENGMEEESSFNLCEAYITRADGCRTPLEVSSLLYAAVSDYTEKIQTSRQRSTYSAQIVSSIDYIYRHLHEIVSLDDLSEETGLTPSYLSYLFKKETGSTITEYIQEQRIEEAKNLLRFSDFRIAEISSFLTFSSQSYFTSVFRKHTGITPRKYRESHYRRIR